MVKAMIWMDSGRVTMVRRFWQPVAQQPLDLRGAKRRQHRESLVNAFQSENHGHNSIKDGKLAWS